MAKVIRRYHQNGLLHLEYFEINGKVQGKSIKYVDGLLYDICPYVNSKLNGLILQFNDNGNLWSSTYYTNGRQDYQLTYNKNGTLFSTFNYLNDNAIGKYKVYYENSILRSICHYSNNKLQGDCIEYDINGNILTHAIYHNGKMIKTII